ncbi:MAG: hypothetical protein ACR2RE_05990, partial [Geminicoccaceae bacterium]
VTAQVMMTFRASAKTILPDCRCRQRRLFGLMIATVRASPSHARQISSRPMLNTVTNDVA